VAAATARSSARVVAGTWKRTAGVVEPALFTSPTRAEERAVAAATERYAAFVE
jgi:hypothetical protein